MAPANTKPPTKPAHRPRKPAEGPFAAWFDASKISAQDLADKLEIALSSVYNLRNGNTKPSGRVAAEIEALSKGAVPATSWWPRPKRKRRAA